jgi:hypothetical protein
MNKKTENIIKHYGWGPIVSVHTIGEYDMEKILLRCRRKKK